MTSQKPYCPISSAAAPRCPPNVQANVEPLCKEKEGGLLCLSLSLSLSCSCCGVLCVCVVILFALLSLLALFFWSPSPRRALLAMFHGTDVRSW